MKEATVAPPTRCIEEPQVLGGGVCLFVCVRPQDVKIEIVGFTKKSRPDPAEAVEKPNELRPPTRLKGVHPTIVGPPAEPRSYFTLGPAPDVAPASAAPGDGHSPGPTTTSLAHGIGAQAAQAQALQRLLAVAQNSQIQSRRQVLGQRLPKLVHPNASDASLSPSQGSLLSDATRKEVWRRRASFGRWGRGRFGSARLSEAVAAFYCRRPGALGGLAVWFWTATPAA